MSLPEVEMFGERPRAAFMSHLIYFEKQVHNQGGWGRVTQDGQTTVTCRLGCFMSSYRTVLFKTNIFLFVSFHRIELVLSHSLWRCS